MTLELAATCSGAAVFLASLYGMTSGACTSAASRAPRLEGPARERDAVVLRLGASPREPQAASQPAEAGRPRGAAPAVRARSRPRWEQRFPTRR